VSRPATTDREALLLKDCAATARLGFGKGKDAGFNTQCLYRSRYKATESQCGLEAIE
jgi:hypothetical protein